MKNRDLRENLAILLEVSQKQSTVSIGEILKILSGKGRVLILILLSLPFCQPLQIPGLSTPFGLVIAFIGFRMAFGKRIWLPKNVLLKTVPSARIQKIAKKVLKLLTKMKRLIRPRFRWLNEHRPMHVCNGLLIVLLGIFLALPLPIPLTNLSAGWATLLLSIGLLEDDGAFLLAGYFVTLLTIVFFILLAFSIKVIF
jgi:hypothetical protein